MDYRNDRWSLDDENRTLIDRFSSSSDHRSLDDENRSINVRFGMLFCLLLVGQDKERTRKNVRKMDYKT